MDMNFAGNMIKGYMYVGGGLGGHLNITALWGDRIAALNLKKANKILTSGLPILIISYGEHFDEILKTCQAKINGNTFY